MEHTTPENEKDEDKCDCPKKKIIPFLDTSISIENGKLEVDLFRKETDCSQYLLPSSCHPKTTTASIILKNSQNMHKHRQKRPEAKRIETIIISKKLP